MGLPNQAPLVFLSHASSDNDRIALPLDAGLRARGLRVWLDSRNLLPGKPLIESIFDQGIGISDAVVVILSANSIERPWVRRELNVSVVQEIEGRVKTIIPVVIDGVRPPISLANTVWEQIPNLSDLNPHLDRIAATILDRAVAAPVGDLPPYVAVIPTGSELAPSDEVVMRLLAAAYIDGPVTIDRRTETRDPIEVAREQGLSDQQLIESFAALQRARIISDLKYDAALLPYSVNLSRHGVDSYLTAYRSDEWRSIEREVISTLVNSGVTDINDLVARVGPPQNLIEHILRSLEAEGELRFEEYIGGADIIIGPLLKRRLQRR